MLQPNQAGSLPEVWADDSRFTPHRIVSRRSGYLREVQGEMKHLWLLLLLLIGCVGIASAADVGVWSRRGSIGVACHVLGGHVVAAVADNTHGVYVCYWPSVNRGMPLVAISSRGTQVSKDGRSVKFYKTGEVPE